MVTKYTSSKFLRELELEESETRIKGRIFVNSGALQNGGKLLKDFRKIEHIQREVQLIDHYAYNLGGCLSRATDEFYYLLDEDCRTDELRKMKSQIKTLENIGEVFRDNTAILKKSLNQWIADVSDQIHLKRFEAAETKYAHYKEKLGELLLSNESKLASQKTVTKGDIQKIQRVSTFVNCRIL